MFPTTRRSGSDYASAGISFASIIWACRSGSHATGRAPCAGGGGRPGELRVAEQSVSHEMLALFFVRCLRRSRGCGMRNIRPAQRGARRRRPCLHGLVVFGVAVKCAFEVSHRDDETRPPVAIAVLEHVVLDECPDAVPDRARHRYALAGEFSCPERGIAVHLADDFLEVAKWDLPDGALQSSERPLR